MLSQGKRILNFLEMLGRRGLKQLAIALLEAAISVGNGGEIAVPFVEEVGGLGALELRSLFGFGDGGDGLGDRD